MRRAGRRRGARMAQRWIDDAEARGLHAGHVQQQQHQRLRVRHRADHAGFPEAQVLRDLDRRRERRSRSAGGVVHEQEHARARAEQRELQQRQQEHRHVARTPGRSRPHSIAAARPHQKHRILMGVSPFVRSFVGGSARAGAMVSAGRTRAAARSAWVRRSPSVSGIVARSPQPMLAARDATSSGPSGAAVGLRGVELDPPAVADHLAGCDRPARRSTESSPVLARLMYFRRASARCACRSRRAGGSSAAMQPSTMSST